MARPKKEKELLHNHQIMLRLTDNLNQIARYFNSGGIHSQEMRNAINQSIARIYEMKYEILKMAGDFHGNTETHSK